MNMGGICGDNRFEIIAKAKAELIKSTNIETSEDEMKVLDNFLFRCWQMDWLERYDKPREPLDIPTISTDFVKEQGLPCPNGYIFKDENGNVINARKIVLEKKKKSYPKTYEECCKVMNYCCNPVAVKTTHKEELIRKFQFLLMYRDAYWKIAGEEMGLGKPWELSIGIPIYYIYYNRTLGTIKNDYADDIQGNVILAFPTEEMRDAFYENFKEEIEICKELL